jgi:transcription elongation factor Elf1
MKILKHGNLLPRRFICKYCGCVFVADLSEYNIAVSGDNFFVICPDCNTKFDMHAPLYIEKNESDVIIDETIHPDRDDWFHIMHCD